MKFREGIFIFGIIFLLGIVSADILSINSGGDNQLVINPGSNIEGFFFKTNENPYDPSPVLVSVDGTNESDADLNCSSYIYDGDSDYLNVSVRWYKDDILNLSIDYNNDYSNGSLFYTILNSDNLSVGDVWKCSIRIYDGYGYSNWVDSNELIIITGIFCGDGTCNGGETCSSCSVDCGTCPVDDGGGGGGGEVVTNITKPVKGLYEFEVYPTFFAVEMNKGTYYKKSIEVSNTGSQELTIGIYVEGVNDFVFPTIRSFILSPGESEEVKLDIYVSDKHLADVYVGKIKFQSNYVTRYTNVILDVKEKGALFDIRTEVLKKYINPGGRVRANVSIINMGDLRNFDVELEYKIIDFDKNVYTVKKEDFAINRTYNNIFYLDAPKGMAVGNYLFYARVLYVKTNVSASSYDTFVIEKVSYLSWIILILIILLLMYLAYRWYKSKEYEFYEKFRQNILKKKEEEKISGKVFGKEKKRVTKVPELP